VIILSGTTESGGGAFSLSQDFPPHESTCIYLQKTGDSFSLLIDFNDSSGIEQDCYCIQSISAPNIGYLLGNGVAKISSVSGASITSSLAGVELLGCDM
jgi:hypothetical protein